MSRDAKRLDALRRSPNDVTLDELARVLADWGFELVRVRGSHHIYRHSTQAAQVTIPARRPLKPVYVRLALAAIESVKDEEP